MMDLKSFPFCYLANGVGTVNGGFLRTQSRSGVLHCGQMSGKESEKILCSQCSTQMMS